MSDLQIVLIIIGGLIIMAVLIFNWWQERRYHQQVENNFSAIKSDALLEKTSLAVQDGADLKPDFDDQDFSISHVSFDETALAADEPAINIIGPMDEPALHFDAQDVEADNAEPETVKPAIFTAANEAIKNESVKNEFSQNEFNNTDTGNFSPAGQFNAPAQKEIIEPTAAQQENIKAIIQEAFSKKPDIEPSPQSPALSEQASQENTPQADTTAPANATHLLPAMLSTQVDLIALLEPVTECTVNAVMQAFKNNVDDYEKPALLHVQTSDFEWHQLPALSAQPELSDQKVLKIACSLQLADRAGPISRMVLQRFQSGIETIGLNLNAHLDWQSTTDPAADAVALDAFCIEVDKTMGFHLVHGENGAFTGTKLRGLAEAQGLELAADGSFKYVDRNAKTQASGGDIALTPAFVMFNRDHYPFSPDMLRQSVIKGVTFQLDIPHVVNCTEAYNHMVQVARQMETGLHAQLVDDNNKPLGEPQIEKIRHQLKILQATMLTKGIVPGSAIAHRLFS